MKQQAMTMMLVLALAGCAQKDSAADAAQPAEATPAAQATDQNKEQAVTDLKPPSPDSVLYLIYQRDGNGAVSYEIEGGATVSYWYGYDFALKGKHYFTGFATRSGGTEGPDAEAGVMEPGHVAIAQATFIRTEEAGKPIWSKPDTDGYVGEFGSNDQPDEVDSTRKPQSQEIADGRLLVAIPTRHFAQGVANATYALFLFDPDNADDLSFREWGYLGTVAAGDDNSAACDDGKVMPCAASTGTLSFEAPGQAGLPGVKIALSGKEISGPGKVRDLGAQDALTYAFDTKEGRYQRQP